MRQLVLMRGCPGAGKSTFIKNNNLEQYTLSADKIRLLFQSPLLKVNGGLCISQKNDNKVWNFLFNCLRERMKQGEFTIIDATHSKSSDFTKYKQLIETYRYRLYCLDFTDVPIEEVKRRNNNREDYKQVPEKVIDNMYSRFQTQNPPSYVKIIKPKDYNKIFQYHIKDVSQYDKIHHIGDIHGCNTVLQNYFHNQLNDNELYIFCGDYIDRGIENADVLNFLFKISDKPNVILLEGNHDINLWKYGKGLDNCSREFNKVTKRELEHYGIDKKSCRKLYRKMQQLIYYKFHDKKVLVTHGGLSYIPDNLIYTSSSQIIRGVGKYEDDIYTLFNKQSNNIYQVHGHRNILHLPVQNDKCFNLENEVEFGGNLRIVTLDSNGFKPIEIKNEIYNENRFIDKKAVDNNTTIEKFVQVLRGNEHIHEKKLNNNISSFNFNDEVFFDKIWNGQTVKARGLFINTNINHIVGRSYDKFFNINENEQNTLVSLSKTLKFPMKAYLKYNGYLGICGYNEELDELELFSKSTSNGEFKQWFKQIFYNQINKEQEKEIKKYLKDNNCNLIFEVIDPINDPHIIEYKEKQIILLDIVYREITFNNVDYKELINFAEKYNFKYKKLCKTFNNYKEFFEWYNMVAKENYLYDNKNIEGFVLEDNDKFMTKIKLYYYTFWKHMRSLKQSVISNRGYRKLGGLTTPLANEFYYWLRKQTRSHLSGNDIITLRNEYYKYQNKYKFLLKIKRFFNKFK